MQAATSYTAEEAFRLNPPGIWELVEGHFVFMSPAGARHGRMVARISRALCEHVEANGLGVVLAGDAGFVLRRAPDVVRAPDVAFLRASRVSSGLPAEFVEGAPDLAVEVVSPGDRWPEVERKATEFISAGSISVWLVDLERRRVQVISAGRSELLGEGGTLTCPDLLGGFTLSLADLW